ncbi:hypothetical protein [Hahella sp. NBU794]|uniref:hypothetical protein n=1 Tax=Hahella sp. NBU794 TaxID=3422590 RepID=UPI003D6DCC79
MSQSGIHRNPLWCCFLALLALYSSHSFALNNAQAEAILKHLHDVQTHSYQTINAYYNFTLNPGDKDIQSEVNQEIDFMNAAFKSLESQDGIVEVQGELSVMSATWLKYKELLNTNMNDIVKVGYPDLRLVGDMAQVNIDLVGATERTYDKTMEISGHRPPEVIELVRNSKIILESMLTKYSARSASNVTQIFQGAKSEEPMDVQAISFDKNIARLLASQQNTDATRKTLDTISTKWEFIKNSYINYNENNVSYVVNLYSKRIISDLDSLAKAYSGA